MGREVVPPSNHHELFVVDVFTYDVPHLHAFLVIFVIRGRRFKGSHLVEAIFPIKVSSNVVAVSDLLPLTDLVIGDDTVSSRLVTIFRVRAPLESVNFDQLFHFCYFSLYLKDQILNPQERLI